MSGTKLEHHLVGVAEVDALGQLALGHAPEVQVVAELSAQQILGIQPVLDHRRRGPLRRDHGVVAQMPPHVVGEVLRSAVLLPRTDHLERVVVEQRDAAGTVVAVRSAQRGHEDAARPAVHGVRPRVSGLGGEFVGLDRVRQHWVSRVGLGVEDISVRRPDTGDDEVAPLHGMALVAVVAQRARAGVPAEVVQFVAGRRKLGPADHLTVRRRRRSRSPPRQARPSPGRPGRMRQRKQAARALRRQRHPGCGKRWDLLQPCDR